MTTWGEFEEAEPAFAARVRGLFDAGRHKTIATLRADGSPRISGIECTFDNGELRFGSMTGARKGADLHRDPRFALHGPTFHPVEGREAEWTGEAKVAGTAVPDGPVTASDAGETSNDMTNTGGADGVAGETPEGEPPEGEVPDGEMFRADITEVVVTGLNDEATLLVIESWTPGRGLCRIERC